MWVRRMSNGDRQRRELLYWKGSGMGLTKGALLSWSRSCGLERRWIEVSCEQSGNTRADLRVTDTDLAMKNAFAGVREGDVGHHACSKYRVDGLW